MEEVHLLLHSFGSFFFFFISLKPRVE